MKLSKQQVFMLEMFKFGWGFKMYNKKPGSWNTFWSLRKKGLLSKGKTIQRNDGQLVAINRLTAKGNLELIRAREQK